MFFDVFPTLEVNGDMKKLLSETEVTKVGMNHEKDHIRIYLNGTRLIHKKNIYQLEKNIHDQIFKNRHMDVKVIEKYQLSEQYTAEKLMDLYKDSILEELKNYSLMEYNLLRSAKMEFTGDSHLLLTLENTIIAQTRSHEIVEFLEKVVCERCGLDLSVELAFEEPKESKHKKNSDLQIQFEIKNILKRVQLHEESAPAKAEEVQPGNDVQTADTSTKTATKEQNHSKESAAGNNAGNANGKGENSFGKKEFRKKYDGGSYGGYKKSDNPDVLYGKDFEDETIPIEKIVGEMGEVTIRCQVMTLETREIRNEKTIVIMSVTDFTDSIVLKIFTRNDQLPELLEGVKKGAFLKIKGVTTIDKFDSELTIGSIVGIKKIPDFTSVRMDTSPEKRVELHCHTKMSDMDGVSEVKDIVKRAMKWGHKAIAITDHGDVQAFPDANHAISPDDDFKVIYGVEAYLVDDLKDIITNSKNQNLDDTYVVFDLETTGFSPDKNKIIEIGAVKVVHGEITERFSTFVNPEVPIPYRIEELTSIRDDMVIDAPKIETILPQFMEFCGDAIMVAHNADFDMSFIIKNCERQGIEKEFTIIDTVALARILLPQLNRFKLDTVAKALGVSLENHHRAVDDAGCTAEIFVKFVKMLHDRGMETLDQVNQMGQASPETIMKMNTYHAIILATNDIGRINLYRLISLSHLTYYNKRPRIPKSEFVKYREGLLLGSACEAGELYRAIVGGRPEEEIIRLVKFYDYLEIQPLGNNEFMLKSDKESVSTIEELQDINRRIVKLGETFGKLVVATCDVHFLDPEDEIYRRIIMAGKGFKDADDQAPLYLRTTEEMLKEFEYLGSAKAEEVVITNPNKIADMCEKIAPVRPDKCPPVIENSDQMLRDICYTKAHSMYGEELPAIVKERLDRELNSIISNGYAVMYIIAQKLVWKSNEDGYLVGSRGSVGSSFAATMSGITEVNPLQAHYRCPNCKYSDFDSPEVKAFSGRSGCDMPDKICPVCGEKLVKDGFDIPFETFLGFKGNKEPDIDLNFSGEYQSKAHAYCEVIAEAKKAGLSAIALTDHDTATGIRKAMGAAKEAGIELIPGIELSTAYTFPGKKQEKEIHIVGLYINPDDPELLKMTAEFRECRDKRNEKMIAALQEEGFPITMEALLAENTDSVITRANIARFLYEHGWIKSVSEAFDKYIGDGCRCYVGRFKVSPMEAVSLIKRTGGIAILAHPLLYHLGVEQLQLLIDDLKAVGLDGIEAIYSTYTTGEEQLVKRIAKENDLLISGGSDFHGENKPAIKLGTGRGHLYIPYSVLTDIKARAGK